MRAQFDTDVQPETHRGISNAHSTVHDKHIETLSETGKLLSIVVNNIASLLQQRQRTDNTLIWKLISRSSQQRRC